MKVKYIGKFDDNEISQQISSEHLTIGKEYVVIELLSMIEEGIFYRLIDDGRDGSLGIFPAIEFEITSTSVATNWVLAIKKNGLIVNGPASWRESEFWEKCYDGDPSSLEIYKQEARIIMKEENAL